MLTPLDHIGDSSGPFGHRWVHAQREPAITHPNTTPAPLSGSSSGSAFSGVLLTSRLTSNTPSRSPPQLPSGVAADDSAAIPAARPTKPADEAGLPKIALAAGSGTMAAIRSTKGDHPAALTTAMRQRGISF